MRKNFYITTPIYYPNAKPHLGTLYSTLIADVTARWHKLQGQNVFFLTGTDEHGQKLQEKAEAEKITPQELVDAIVPAFKDLWHLYEIEYSKFIRTTDPEHIKGVEAWIKLMIKQGDIYKSTYSGWYCVPDETFVNVGSDPLQDEKGNYLCPTCKRGLRQLEEESYFFRLSAYEERLLKFYEDNPDFVTPKERLHEVVSFVKSGLKDLSISRKSVSWGIPFPNDPSHTVYVWADALNNYLTGIGFGQTSAQAREQFVSLWPADVQVMAKDILRFHAVYWPAFLMAADLPLPRKLLVHGYILMGDDKMSKSLGNAIDPTQLAAWYGVEQIRYYLLRQMPISHDGRFDLKDLESRIESDLANSLGNLLSRVQVLAINNGLQTVKPVATLEATSEGLRERCEESFRFYWDEMTACNYHSALAELWKFIAEVNAFFQKQKPWDLAKSNKELFAEVISTTCHSLYAIAVMLWPVMPKKAELLLTALGYTFEPGKDYPQELRGNVWDKTFVLHKLPEPLFIRPEIHSKELEAAPAPQAAPAPDAKQIVEAGIAEIGIEDFVKVHLAVGTILACDTVHGSDKLYRLQLDFGPLGQRQIFSGVAQHFKPEDLIGKQGVGVVNLKPRKMMGQISQGMMLFADDGNGKLQLTTVGAHVANGSRVK